MTLVQQCLSLVRKYGPVAKVVATGVLNVVAPGSGTLIDLAGKALDAASQVAEKTARENFENELLTRVHCSEGEINRLGQLLEQLTGPLAVLCDKAAAFADQPDDLPDIIGRAIAANPALAQVLRNVGDLKEQFDSFKADIRKVAQRQDEAVPVYARMDRVADYFDEMWAAGVKPADFAQCVRMHMDIARHIRQGQVSQLDPLLLELRTKTPKAASVLVLEAAAATREFDYPAAQRALATAIRLKPSDGELGDLSRRVTQLGSRVTPPQPPSPQSAKPKRLQPGDLLDGWKLEIRLGAGGWGQVFKAVRDGQTKALKVMHPDLAADRPFVERFKKEIETLIKLPRHPNLVRIESFGYCTDRQTWYLTMEYIDGPTLEQYLTSKGPLSEGQVRKVFADAIEGLAKAHAAGLVHRDIKPGNLILRKADQKLVFVAFGLAAGVEDFGNTKVGGISILFAAPEQHVGDRAAQASDVYSLCAVIHYCLNYDKPEQRKSHRFAPGLAPESVRGCLTRGLKHNIDERLRDGTQLAEAFAPTKQVESLAKRRSEDLSQGEIGQVIEIPLTGSLMMKFAWVPPGQSWLGGGSGTPGQQPFKLDRGLWCGVYPVIHAEWQAVMGNNPSYFKNNPRHPVETVSYQDVKKFLGELNGMSCDRGLLFRLPTEQEWEYICRGAALLSPDQSKYHFYFARSTTDLTPAPTNDLSSNQANFGCWERAHGTDSAGSASESQCWEGTCEVGLYLPNPLGIYDLHGNVYEWTSSRFCQNVWDWIFCLLDSFRVIRGGSWKYHEGHCTASHRGNTKSGIGINEVGFRVLAVPVGS